MFRTDSKSTLNKPIKGVCFVIIPVWVGNSRQQGGVVVEQVMNSSYFYTMQVQQYSTVKSKWQMGTTMDDQR